MDEKKTIAALATPAGKGGIGIIRISGSRALDLTKRFFYFPSGKQPDFIESHRVHYGFIRDETGTTLDEVLFIFMKAPRSYTAEDVVEIQSHASPVVLRSILSLLVRNGVSLAEPGEFTKRAYLNGRIDLTQAEAVIDIINARTEISLNIALSQVEGSFGVVIHKIREKLLSFLAKVEAAIDFPDDVGDIIDSSESIEIIIEFRKTLLDLKKNHDVFRMFREGVNVVIAGPPNTGKSSLLNALLEKEKAIVTSVPGTTRDLIEDLIVIDGVPLEITDTAGIRQTDDIVEKIGIDKTFDKIKTADLLILLIDQSENMSDSECNSVSDIYRSFSDSEKVLIVANKCDLPSKRENNSSLPEPDITISVKTGENFDALKAKIAERVLHNIPDDKSTIVPNVRQNNLIVEVLSSLDRIIDGIENMYGYEFVAMDIKAVLQGLDLILGITPGDDVLDRIFDLFCIGK